MLAPGGQLVHSTIQGTRGAHFAAAFLFILLSVFGLCSAASAQVSGWGTDLYGAIYPLMGQTNVKQIASGDFVNVALLNNGSLEAYGEDIYSSGITTPPSGSNYTQVSCFYQHALALQDNGRVSAWGYNSAGEATQFSATTKAGSSNTNVTVTATQGSYSSAVSVPVKT